MAFDFDEVIDRSGTFAEKWDEGPDVLPLWVADMDFRTAPCVAQAIERRAAHGVFGYTAVPQEWREAVAGWWRTRHALNIAPENLLFVNGVLPALAACLHAFTNPAEGVALLAPTYNHFYYTIKNNARTAVEVPLVYSAETTQYSIDFAALERTLAKPDVTLLVLCNPQNPTGNVWSAADLARIGELAAANMVFVVSDEIHCDVMRPGTHHTPFAAASPTCAGITVTLCSPSKAFNLAGVQSAYAFTENPLLRTRLARALAASELDLPNAFAIDATIAAYTQGEAWLNELCAYIQANKDAVATFCAEGEFGVRCVEGDATYLCWLDCHDLLARAGTDPTALDASALTAHLHTHAGLRLTRGAVYGQGGAPFMRLNAGTQRTRLQTALTRLANGCTSYRV